MGASGDTVFRRRAGSVATAGRLVISFLVLILVGSVLLALPVARQPGVPPLSWLDAVFVATSAACVTGLSTVNVGLTFSPFGQAVILGLIQLGGLGITTAGTLFLLVRRGTGSLASEDFIAANVGRLRDARPVDVFIYSCFVVLTIELTGTVGLTYLVLEHHPTATFSQALWEAAFHSVSAFCNAGFSTYEHGLIAWRDDWRALGVTSVLVVAGGIGLLTLVNFRYYYPWRRDRRRRGRLTLQTRLCLYVSLVLLALGTLFTWINELDHTGKEAPGWRGLLWAFVHSTMTRTAGFNVVNLAEMAPETLLGSLVLMFVGGSPGSMAGGIKVTTLVLLGVVAWSALRRRSDLVLGRNTIAPAQANNAVMVALLSAIVLVAGIGLLMNVEAQRPAVETPLHWLALIFEATSAFSTVGLSTGITELLSPGGKFIVAILMFVGRLGPLCLAMHLARPPQPSRITFPRDDVASG
jgi:trk system potassium uptake protein TrkH